MIDLSVQRYALFALTAAALFGASTPFAKLLIGDLSPVALAGLLYLGSGCGLLLTRLAMATFGGTRATNREAPLRRRDLPWLAGAIVAGGVVAPVLLLWGLSGSSASSASLLLNLEGVITTLVAALIFREAVGARIWLAAAIMLAASVLLSYDPQAAFGFSLRALAIVGACLCWGLDNNLTRKVSASDPALLAMIKGLVAGAVNLGLAVVVIGMPVPSMVTLGAALVVGFFGYGISLVLFIYALRHLGSARAGAHFSTAPFIGAGVAILVFGDPVTPVFALALVMMAGATWLVLTERHAHSHAHEPMAHAHRHVHDEHHQHAHRGDEGPEPHAHEHAHAPLTHSHPHVPDLHHRHGH